MNIASLNVIVDINKDGSYSVWELWEAAKIIYRLPGNLIIEALGNTPYVSSMLDIQASQATGYSSLNGSLSVTLSLIFWVVAVFSILTLTSPSEDVEDVPGSTGKIGNPNAATTSLASDTLGFSKTSGHTRVHLPVSRASYPAPGKKPKRRRHAAHLSDAFARSAK